MGLEVITFLDFTRTDPNLTFPMGFTEQVTKTYAKFSITHGLQKLSGLD